MHPQATRSNVAAKQALRVVVSCREDEKRISLGRLEVGYRGMTCCSGRKHFGTHLTLQFSRIVSTTLDRGIVVITLHAMGLPSLYL